MKLEFYRQIFEKYSNTKFNENPSSANGVVSRGHTEGNKDRRTGGQMDMTKLIIAFCNFENTLKKETA
jgi:hypothetical protein